jgi:hypothetical protein
MRGQVHTVRKECATVFCPALFLPHPLHSEPGPSSLHPCMCVLQWGTLFSSSMKRAGVDVSGVLVKQGPTGRSCILSCGGQRTMRTCLSGCPRINPDELRADDFRGVPWVFLSACEAHATSNSQRRCWGEACNGTNAAPLGLVAAILLAAPLCCATLLLWGVLDLSTAAHILHAPPTPPPHHHHTDCLYTPNLLERALDLAGAAGCSVAMDLASFEVVRRRVVVWWGEAQCKAAFASHDTPCLLADVVLTSTSQPRQLLRRHRHTEALLRHSHGWCAASTPPSLRCWSAAPSTSASATRTRQLRWQGVREAAPKLP